MASVDATTIPTRPTSRRSEAGAPPGIPISGLVLPVGVLPSLEGHASSIGWSRGRIAPDVDASRGVSVVIGAWDSYYVASAGAAAVLLGLVFVGLSVHFERNSDRARIRALAVQSAVSLLYALLISLAMLVPEGRPASQAVILGIICLFGLWTSGVATVDGARADTSPIALFFRFVLPLLAMIFLGVAAVLLAAQQRLGVWLVGAIVFVHIVLGTQNAWDLFLGAADTIANPDGGAQR